MHTLTMTDDSELPPSLDEIRDTCFWKKCRHESDIILLGFGVCQEHYEKYLSLHPSPTVGSIKELMSAKFTKLISNFYKEI